jgi:serine/threonine-protein kinase
VSPQQTIAHYRITSKLGEGGMGEVWRATDTKLGRDVAIKILPESFAQDADRLARFQREAQVLASLNHPNIAAIYGVEERALVMELVPGPTLAERIAQGPIPTEESLALARQIIDALEYAHERGVVHRDLKPANIKITPEGRVKVLDFGLAKAMTPEGPASDPASSPTLTMRATMAGVILGTAAYMSPEQARGQNADKRADIWSFGVVLYEMLTGRALFTGPTISDTLAAVLTREPDWNRVTARARRLLQRCLEKNPKRRLRDIGDAFPLLDEAPEAPLAVSRTPWAVAAVLAVALAATGGLSWRATRPVDHPLVRLNVDLGPDALAGLSTTVAISPDGRRIVFPARGPDGRQHLATRLLDQAQPTMLPGTEGAHDPFFSPDGQSIGFFHGGELKRIPAQGGVPVTLGSATVAQGASWSADDSIAAAVGTVSPIQRIPATGGARQALTKQAPGELSHRWPQVLPGARAVVFTAASSINAMDNASIEAVSLQTGQVKLLYRGGYYGRYLPSGHLVFVHQGALFGVKFDPDRLEVRGSPVPLLEDIAANPGASWGGDGNIVAAMNLLSPLSRVPDRGGTPQRVTKLVPGEFSHRWPQILPGGQSILFTAAPTNIGLDDANIEALLLKSGVTRVVQRGGYHGRFLPSGHLVYLRQGVLFGVGFDADRLEVRGTPAPLVQDIAGDSGTGGGRFDSSETGTLVYLGGSGTTQGWPIVWLDSLGKFQPLLIRPGAYYHQRVSPDGQRLVFTEVSSKGSDISVYDPKRDTLTRLTFDGRALLPVWTPDGGHIAFRISSGGFTFGLVRSDGAGEAQRFVVTPKELVPYSFSPDGRRLACHEVNKSDTGFDLWTVPLDTSDPDHTKVGKPEPFLRTPFDERAPSFSPDGRWIAYSSNESGPDEVYVRPFPPGGGRWQVSSGGGQWAMWSKSSHELFYEAPDNRLMAVEYSVSGASFVPGKPKPWSSRQIFNPGTMHLDVAPDGKRFAVLAPPENAGSEKGSVRVTFMLNFFDELRRRIPTDR